MRFLCGSIVLFIVYLCGLYLVYVGCVWGLCWIFMFKKKTKIGFLYRGCMGIVWDMYGNCMGDVWKMYGV